MQEKDKNINRIKAVLEEQNRTSKLLTCQLNKDQTTVSKCLNIGVRDLIVKTETE